MAAKRHALVSVSDKRFVTNFARDLVNLGYEVISTGGTFQKLREAKIPCRELSRVFKAPELIGGRVKSLHAQVHAAVLADRDNPTHMKDLARVRITPIDLVVVNFYQFSTKVKAGKTPLSGAIELIDIGGPALARAAAKNYRHVGVVTSVDQYREVARHLKEHDGELTESFKLRLAREAFHTTAQFDATVAGYFDAVGPKVEETLEAEPAQAPADLLPRKLTLQLRRMSKLRYGENPHQQAARYSISGLPTVGLKVLQGKEMSYNNYLDASAALTVVSSHYPKPCVACVVKHLNPCGIAVGDDPVKTFILAREADPKSAFGGIVGLSYPVDRELAKELRKTFFEIILAPKVEQDARRHLSAKKNLRLIETSPSDCHKVLEQAPKVTPTLFGAMLQGYDVAQEEWEELQVVTNREPPAELQQDILLGLTFIRFLKSNSLCVVKDGVMVGVGVGQMSRVDAAEIALRAAGKRAKNAVLISDGFFPFADSVELAAKAQVGCVVAPAGSKRDMEVVAAANKLKLPLIFAPRRHFLH